MQPADGRAARVRAWRDFGARVGLLGLASYGLLYFSYKFLQTWGGTGDFFYYYPVYVHPLDLHAAMSPFVLRQVSAVVTHLVWKAHIFYPNQIAFHEPGLDPHIFFAALFTNWVFLILAAAIAGEIAMQIAGRRDQVMALLGGLFCLLSFFSQYVVISGDTEGPAWFLLALGFLGYVRRSRTLLALALLLAIVERETILVAFGCLSVLDLLRSREAVRFKSWVFACALACFGVYVWLRKLTAGYEEQLHASGWAAAFHRTHFDGSLLFQGFLTQNVIALALLMWLALKGCKRADGAMVLPLLGTVLCLDVGGLAAGITNNIGRVGGVLTPAFAGLAGVYAIALARSLEPADSAELHNC